jgi:hypothetical protein
MPSGGEALLLLAGLASTKSGELRLGGLALPLRLLGALALLLGLLSLTGELARPLALGLRLDLPLAALLGQLGIDARLEGAGLGVALGSLDALALGKQALPVADRQRRIGERRVAGIDVAGVTGAPLTEELLMQPLKLLALLALDLLDLLALDLAVGLLEEKVEDLPPLVLGERGV